MNALLIDAGNSRLKWATLRDGRLGALHAADWTRANLAGIVTRIARQAGQPGQVLVACVGGAPVRRALRDGLRRARLPAPRFAVSQRQAAGVSSAYHWPEQLGVDRWLSLLAARTLHPSESVCIVSVGTALTIDLLDNHGRHAGGVIVPGPTLMRDALLSRTAEIRSRARRGASSAGGARVAARTFFARDTHSAIHSGGVHTAVALVEYALSLAQTSLGHPPRLILSGGGARTLQRLLADRELGAPMRRIDNLVLRGLAVLAQQESG